MKLPKIHSEKDIINLIREFGILPFFKNETEGFSIEEACPPELWFVDGTDGPWEWKGPVIRDTHCAYGKFYRGKACFMTRELFCELANVRRDGYDYDSRVDEGIARSRDIPIMNTLAEKGAVLSKKLKDEACSGPDALKKFDGNIIFLQMQCYVLTSDFVYMTAKNGKKYGWGVAEYSTPEYFFGAQFSDNVYKHSVEESREIICGHFRKVIPQMTDSAVKRFIG